MEITMTGPSPAAFAETQSPSGGQAALRPDPTARLADLAVLVDGTAADEDAIACCETIAAVFGAHLDVFLVNHIGLPVLPAGPGAGWLAAQVVEQCERVGDAAALQLRERLGRLGVAWELRRRDGAMSEILPEVVRLSGTCDLVGISQQALSSSVGMDLLEAVVFTAGSGALVAPRRGAAAAVMPETILVGWRDTPECAHAVAAALPFLQRAGQVVLASVAEEGSSEQRGLEPMADMARHLARHGVSVETRELANWQDAAEGLMHEAEVLGAQMIVIGAYGHSRMRELLLGGVTRELLRSSRVPLLLAH
ncbi:universal stress protein [Jiella sp. M17.18]|uniref:universal stress protein n=1 Tax=Jiella sp. M17.18 TaxID=3234247 RepID=UPI0034DFADAA